MTVMRFVSVAPLTAGVLLMGASWSSCQMELDTLQSRSGDASYAASAVKRAYSRLENAKEEFESCRAYPGAFDLYRDRCRTLAAEYEDARGSFQSAKRRLDSALGDIDSSMQSASSYCGYSVSSMRGGSTASGDSMCRFLQSMKGRVGPEKLMETCTKAGKSVEQCKPCVQ